VDVADLETQLLHGGGGGLRRRPPRRRWAIAAAAVEAVEAGMQELKTESATVVEGGGLAPALLEVSCARGGD